jgi:hypothetical protein
LGPARELDGRGIAIDRALASVDPGRARTAGGARFALELGLAACALCLVVENAALLLVFGQRVDWSAAATAARAAFKVLALVAGATWPWPVAAAVALLGAGGVVLALMSKLGKRVRHA